jgi:uncharacterized Tic20 family protein
MSTAEELDKLKKLHAAGTITDEQYERAKAKLEAEMEAAPRDERAAHDERRPEPEERDERRARRPWRRDDRDKDEEKEDYEPRPSSGRRRQQAREWGMILHLSVLLGHLVAVFGGIIAPIVIWQMKKDKLPDLDQHGKNAVNWILSFFLYFAISVVLCFVFIGIPLLLLLLLMNFVFPIIAAVKANEGRVWKYPLAIQFLK